MSEVFCRGPECDRPAFRGDLCETHTKQMQRTGKLTPIAEKLTETERLLELVNRWAQADGDEEYESSRRAVLVACKGIGRGQLSDSIVEGLQRARSNGKRIGRKPKVDEELLRRVFKETGNVAKTARAVGLSYSAAYERIHRKRMVSDTRERRRRPSTHEARI